MVREKQTQSDTGELLQDIRYVNQQNRGEINRLSDRFNHFIDAASLPTSVASSLVTELSAQLGQLSARVKLTEKAIGSLQSKHQSETVVWTAGERNDDDPQSSEHRERQGQMTATCDLMAPEFSANGISFCWSGSNPEIQFAFTVKRRVELQLKIRLFALIKLNYLKRMKILVDGEHLKHSFGLEGPYYVARCIVPAAATSDRTLLKIVLPDTHSPAELATTNDNRKLGLAITNISFGTPERRFLRTLGFAGSIGFVRLRKRLGAKK